jgi:hypothetical protein
MALTDVEIRAAKPQTKANGDPKAYSLSDAGGLYLLISKKGGKLWRWNYRYDRKSKTMTTLDSKTNNLDSNALAHS